MKRLRLILIDLLLFFFLNFTGMLRVKFFFNSKIYLEIFKISFELSELNLRICRVHMTLFDNS